MPIGLSPKQLKPSASESPAGMPLCLCQAGASQTQEADLMLVMQPPAQTQPNNSCLPLQAAHSVCYILVHQALLSLPSKQVCCLSHMHLSSAVPSRRCAGCCCAKIAWLPQVWSVHMKSGAELSVLHLVLRYSGYCFTDTTAVLIRVAASPAVSSSS